MLPRVAIIPGELQRRVEGELQSGERLVWAGQPMPGAYARQAIAIVLFGIPWTAFAVFWIVAAAGGVRHFSSPGVFSFFPLFGLPFVLIGLGMLSSPFWLRLRARRTVYAITDRRAIVMAGRIFGGVAVQSFLPDRLTSMTRNERRSGAGDLIFEQFSRRAGSGTQTVRRGFMGVDRVREVEELITATLLAGRVRAV